MNWLTRWSGLNRAGVLGMNARNTHCILDLNPRERFPLVDDKRQMHELCRTIGVPTPDLYAALLSHSALRHLPRILEKHDQFVIKPNRGAAGRGILVIAGRDGVNFRRHNDQLIAADELRQHVSGILSGLFSLGGNEDEALIQERIVSDPILERVSYQGAADVRVVLYRCEPAMAMIRLPTRASGGRANLHQGAIGVGIDLDNGRTCHAVLRSRKAELHPDTGESVIGFQIPRWREMIAMSRTVSRAIGLGYVGVDIILDHERGPLLLEANARPGLAIQIANGMGLMPRLEQIDRGLSN